MLITSGMRITGCGMQIDWELREAGPRGGARTVLLLPGGLCGAGSYAETMAEPALAGVRLVAATLPGHAGAPPPDDYSIENYALLTSELAMDVGADVVVGFSMARTGAGQERAVSVGSTVELIAMLACATIALLLCLNAGASRRGTGAASI